MSDADLVLGYLSFVNEKNKHIRLDDLRKSVASLSKLSRYGRRQKRFVSVDNMSCPEARQELKRFPWDAELHYDTNFYDVAVFYSTLWCAEMCGAPYFAWMYDDFIVYDDALDDCLDFLDANPDISCVRLPVYDYHDQKPFNTQFTTKNVNPDAVRHYNTATNSELSWEAHGTVGNHVFYSNNWHYTSRPTLFRTDFFRKVIDQQQDITRILQGFEMWAIHSFQNAGMKVGVLQGGMMKTTPIDRSARYLALTPSQEMAASTDVKALRGEFDRILGS